MQLQTFGSLLLVCLAVGVLSDSTCDHSPFVHNFIAQLNSSIKAQKSTLDSIEYFKGRIEQPDYYEWFEHPKGDPTTTVTKASWSDASSGLYDVFMSGLSAGISAYSCGPALADKQVPIRLQFGTGNVSLKGGYQFEHPEKPREVGANAFWSTKIVSFVTNVHLGVLGEHTFTLENVNVENFRFTDFHYDFGYYINSIECDSREEYKYLEVFFIREMLNSVVRREIETKTMVNLIRSGIKDPARQPNVEKFLVSLFSTDLPKSLAGLELLSKYVSHTIKEPDQVWAIHHEKIAGFDSVTTSRTLESNKGKWTFGTSSSGLQLKLQLDINTEKLEKPKEGIPLTTELEPLNLNFAIEDSGTQLTLVSLSVEKPKNRIPFTATISESNVKQEVEKHVLPPSGTLPKEFDSMFESIRALLEAEIRKFVTKKLAEFQD